MRILDLFCGCGGFSLGFRRVFPEAEIIGVDLDRWACRTYQRNRVGQAVRADVRHLPIRLEQGLFDIIIGGPPCEPFSKVNRIKRGRKHPLWDLVLWFLYYVIAFHPKVWVMENVPDILKDPFYGPLFRALSGEPIQQTLDAYSEVKKSKGA